MPVARLVLNEHVPGADVEGGKQCRSTVAHIIVRHSFHIAKSHGLRRLGAIQGLAPRLFVDRQHDGMIRRVQIQAYYVRAFLTKNEPLESLKFLLRCGGTTNS